MKYFAKFTEKGIEGLGSDSVFVLDGRCNIHQMILDATKQMLRLKAIKPNYDGFKIMKGDMRSAIMVKGVTI